MVAVEREREDVGVGVRKRETERWIYHTFFFSNLISV